MRSRLYFVFLIASMWSIYSCNITKYIPEGEKLYTGAEVTLKMDTIRDPEKLKAFEENLKSLTLPNPNKKAFGVPWKLLFWNIGYGDSTNNIVRNWFKKRGEAPVLLSDVNREYNENLLRNRLENLGFFNATVSSDTIVQGKRAKVVYTGIPKSIYRINKVFYDLDSLDEISRDIFRTRNESLLKVGSNYNLDVIISERERIDNDLKNKGYYYFNADNLLIEVDSTIGNHKVNMYITIKPQTTIEAKNPQHIGNIFIYPNYTLSSEGYTRRRPTSTMQLYDNNFYIIDPKNIIRKKVLANHIFFDRGQLYNRYDHNQTINHLVNLNMFKFVKNNFENNPDSTNVLDVYYYLTPMAKKSLRFEVLAKTANVYNGSEANVTWTLRNAFKGAETFTANVFGGYETQTGGNVNLNSSYYRYGAELGITWPRLLSPYKWTPSRRYIPQTYLRFRYEFLNRKSAYVLNSSTLNFGYKWNESERKTHDLTLAEIIYVQPRNITDAYKAQMDTVPTLRRIVDRQFSIGPNYTFTSTNSLDVNKKSTYYFKGGINLSGNILGLIQGADYNKGEIKKIFGAAYSQFVKVELDGRHYLKLGGYNELATRIMVGMSYSYGNSNGLPYLKQFYAGGPYGLRGFRARSVGPGISPPENVGAGNFFADQTGDYKLELNAEYRGRIVDFGMGILNWAAFIDAGNIWTQNPNPDKPGANITKNFLNQLAVDGGAGLRFDFSFLIIRTDLGIPLRIPYYPKGERWVFKDIDFKNSTWRQNNLVFNLAIGYPF
ncbi:translocation and assembly module lipoprotein TamL [Sphingobacterium rhinopitheci]|uniref:translocation and assembly module lipoprotein TamL n=1 Tax=Sphingobacterium rhinopitheci TaxID=2781960 RepID=UPI001F51CC5F|nr:BamA/TamA family outer membrane protein [Sphingobacterium rhinopitheci]